MPRKLTKKELIERAKEQGLPIGGSENDLRRRLGIKPCKMYTSEATCALRDTEFAVKDSARLLSLYTDTPKLLSKNAFMKICKEINNRFIEIFKKLRKTLLWPNSLIVSQEKTADAIYHYNDQEGI